MNPAIAFDGTNFLIAWQDLPREHVGHLRKPNLASPRWCSTERLCGRQRPNAEETPAIAFDGANYLSVGGMARPTTAIRRS